jgi:uncharacterized membrane protein (DUF485 family)
MLPIESSNSRCYAMSPMGPNPDEPAAPERLAEARSGEASRANTRRGLVLFAAYLAAYGAFVVLNAFHPLVMEATPVAGLNVAVLYGMGLIAGAFALAVIYVWLCREGGR